MYERFIFATEIERGGTRQLIGDAWPLAKVWDVYDEDDYVLDAEIPCSQETFFRYAATTPGPARLLIHSCYYLSLLLHEPPLWMVQEMRRLLYSLPGEVV